MSFRTVVVKERCKLDLKLNYLVCRKDDEQRIYLPEISYLIIESTAVSLTSALLCELVKNNVKVIFCDEKHNPISELIPLYGVHNSSKRIKEQLSWKEETKGVIWKTIIKDKILKQREILIKNKLSIEADMLLGYASEVLPFDESNREGHSAKVYFNALFGKEFIRQSDSFHSNCLNYGYTILLSCFNREITKSGYLTQLGIWHKIEFNQFNLSSDLMEPFRPLIDRLVLGLKENEDFKEKILEIFKLQIRINDKLVFFENAISIYTQSVFNALENDDESLVLSYEL